MRSLSKSKLLAFRQCPKRLWLELNKPESAQVSPASETRFSIGHGVGAIARRIYDPEGKGKLVDAKAEGFSAALKRSEQLLQSSKPIFEAGFSAGGALAFADVMLPIRKGQKKMWRMVEVKSSTSVKDYHRDDAAIQSLVAQSAGVPLASIAVARIDNRWVYAGDGKYDGLLIEEDLSEEAMARTSEVKEWIAEAQAIASKTKEPKRTTGAHCTKPFECGFVEYCKAREPQPQHAIDVLPNPSVDLRAYVAEKRITELKDVPDRLLNGLALRVKQSTLSGKVYFDVKATAGELSKHKLPALFLDFETVSMAVPIWKGMRPYQQISFQFSLHTLMRSGTLEHQDFIDLSGNDPSTSFATALVEAAGTTEPIFVYNASFEKSRIAEIAERQPKLRRRLLAINERIVDLLPIARQHYYHRSQQGSWSIKAVLPAVVPDLDYGDLDGVKDGGMAMDAFLEAIRPETPPAQKQKLEKQLRAYCKLDTYAMVRIWQVFADRLDLKL